MDAARKHLDIATKAASTGVPDAAELAAIRSYHLREFKAEELYVRNVLLAHNGIDRDNEVFDEPFLERMASTIRGKGLFEIHPLSWEGDPGMPEGLWFDARVERMSFEEARKILRAPELKFPPDRAEAAILIGKFYMPATASNQDMRTKIDAGLGYVSVSFTAARREPIKDAAGRELEARRISGDGEALEASLVWLGAQPGARVMKTAQPPRGATVNLKSRLLPLLAGLLPALAAGTEPSDDQVFDAAKALSERQQAGQPDAKIGKFDAAAKALGEDAKLLDNPLELVAILADAKGYRTVLLDELVAADRAAGRCKGDTAEDVAAHKALYAGLATAQLKALHAAATATSSTRTTGLAPSNPNPTAKGAPGPEAKAPAALDSPLLA